MSYRSKASFSILLIVHGYFWSHITTSFCQDDNDFQINFFQESMKSAYQISGIF